MKNKLMNPTDQAADAFYGQDAAAFAQDVDRISGHDLRLLAVFHRTREIYLQNRPDGDGSKLN